MLQNLSSHIKMHLFTLFFFLFHQKSFVSFILLKNDHSISFFVEHSYRVDNLPWSSEKLTFFQSFRLVCHSLCSHLFFFLILELLSQAFVFVLPPLLLIIYSLKDFFLQLVILKIRDIWLHSSSQMSILYLPLPLILFPFVDFGFNCIILFFHGLLHTQFYFFPHVRFIIYYFHVWVWRVQDRLLGWLSCLSWSSHDCSSSVYRGFRGLFSFGFFVFF